MAYKIGCAVVYTPGNNTLVFAHVAGVRTTQHAQTDNRQQLTEDNTSHITEYKLLFVDRQQSDWVHAGSVSTNLHEIGFVKPLLAKTIEELGAK